MHPLMQVKIYIGWFRIVYYPRATGASLGAGWACFLAPVVLNLSLLV